MILRPFMPGFSSKVLQKAGLISPLPSSKNFVGKAARDAGKKKGPGRKAKPKAVPKKVRKKERGDDEDDREPAEDSDDGDYETREVDYETSDTDEGDARVEDSDAALKGVDEEVQEMEDEEDEEEEDKEETEKDKQEGTADDNGGSESDNEEEDFDAIADSVIPQSKKQDVTETSAGAASSVKKDKPVGNSPPKGKRKLESDSPIGNKRKPGTSEGSSVAPTAVSSDGKLDEEALVRRYLSRKPFTSKELLRKLTKHGIKPEDINSRLGEIIKRLNPEKTSINGKLYLHLRA